jgi:hypothetical protein
VSQSTLRTPTFRALSRKLRIPSLDRPFTSIHLDPVRSFRLPVATPRRPTDPAASVAQPPVRLVEKHLQQLQPHLQLLNGQVEQLLQQEIQRSSLPSILIADEEERDCNGSTDLRDSLSGNTHDRTLPVA